MEPATIRNDVKRVVQSSHIQNDNSKIDIIDYLS